MNFFKILSIISLISSWMKTALEDGKITLREALELIGLLAESLGLPLDFSLADIKGLNFPEAEKPPGESKPYTGGLTRPNQPE